MIKVNLLDNHFAVPIVKETTDTDTSASKVIQREAKKSARRLSRIVLLLIGVIGGSVASYMQRYEIVETLEQYTGPLNILPPRDIMQDAEVAEDVRQERIRQLYMLNTVRVQERDFLFLSRVDSTKNAMKDRIYLFQILLDGNDFSMKIYGKTEKDVAEFTKTIIDSRQVEDNKPSSIEPSTALKDKKFKRTLNGTLKGPGIASDADAAGVKTNFLEPDRTLKKIIEMAKANSLKVSQDPKMTTSKGVVMITHSGEFALEGTIASFTKYIHQINQLNLNVELTEYQIDYTNAELKKADKIKNDKDVATLKFNVLTPSKPAETHTPLAK